MRLRCWLGLTFVLVLAITAGAQTVTTLTAPSTGTTAQPLTLVASVTDGGGLIQSGSVTFRDGTKSLGVVQVVGAYPATGFSTGTATLKTRLSAGNHSVTAQFNGTNAYASSTSGPALVVVSGSAISATVLTATPNGSNFDFTATVQGYGLTIPTGAVNLSDITVPSSLGPLSWQPSSSSTHITLGQTYSVGGYAGYVAVGDFDGDGIADLVIANGSMVNGSPASLMLGNSDGTFQPAVPINLPSGQTSIAVGDFNGDGNLDLIFAVDPYNITGNGGVYVVLGNGDGTFQPAQRLGVANAWTVAVADFNGDGFADIVTDSSNQTGVRVLLGNGDGTFQPPIMTSVSGAGEGLTVGDFDGDGKPDVIVPVASDSSPSDSGYLAKVLLGNGDGTFEVTQQGIPSSEPFQTAAVGDFNGDGKLDVAVFPWWGTSGVSYAIVALGNGDGTFQPAQTYTAGKYGRTGVVGDFDGDGNIDLAVANENESVTILKGNGDGSFQQAVEIPVNSLNQPSAVAAGKFTGDGSDGLVVSNDDPGSISVLLHSASITATATNIAIVGAGTHTIQASYSPDSASEYAASSGTTNVTIAQATPSISWANPAAITYGAALGAAQLNASSGDVAGTFTYSPAAGTVLAAGAHTLSVIFTPTNSTNDITATATVPITVNQASPSISWANPAAITYGTALGATQLDASLSVPGECVYTPAAGTVLSVGTYSLSVSCTPTDALDYSTATTTTAITVNSVGAGDFEIDVSPTSGTVPLGSGQSWTSVLSVKSLNSFVGNVTLTCQGIAPTMGCNFSLPTVAASNAGTPSTLVVTTQGRTLTMVAGLFGVFGVCWPRKKRARRAVCVIAIFLATVFTLGMLACGVGTRYLQNDGTPRGTYGIVVTGTSGNITHSKTLKVSVE